MSGANVFNRLGFSFDVSKFGTAINLSQTTRDFLNTQPISLETWQKSDLANGSIVSSDYYKNPLADVCDQILVITKNLANNMNKIEIYDVSGAQTVIETATTTASNLVIEIQSFKNHVSNISGLNTTEATVPEDGSPVLEYPDYDKAVQLGQDLLLLLNNTDNIQDSTPVLGSMTSIFVGTELSQNSSSLTSANNTISQSLRTQSGNVYSNITVSQAYSVLNTISSTNNFVSTRRTHDWNFYREGLKLMEDYLKIDRLENVGNTQLYLINNYIGTESYKQKLSANN